MYDLGFDLPSRMILSKPAVLQPAVGTWTASNATLANNAVTAPDGTATASTITATGATIAEGFTASFTALIGVVYAFSAYISSASGPWAIIELSDGTNGCEVWFDPNAGVVGSNFPFGNGAFVGAFIRPAANSFFLATALMKLTGAATPFPFIACANANGANASTISQVLNVWHPTIQPLT